MLPLLIAALLSAEAPTPSPCACTCFRVLPAEGTVERARMDYERADGVFMGRVLASWTERGGSRTHYTFAVRQSWKGVDEDTAHVVVPANLGCESVYARGRSYLVLAARGADGFTPPACDPVIYPDSTRLAVYLSVLGTPRRSFPADTVRSIEALAPPSTPHVPGPTWVVANVYRGHPHRPDAVAAAGVRVSVAGTGLGGTTDAEGRVDLRGLDTRWYRFRFEFPDGEVHEEYVRPRCSDGAEPCTLSMLRFYIGPDEPGR